MAPAKEPAARAAHGHDRHGIGPGEMLSLAGPAVPPVSRICRFRRRPAIAAIAVAVMPGEQRARLREDGKLMMRQEAFHRQPAQIDERMVGWCFALLDGGAQKGGARLHDAEVY